MHEENRRFSPRNQQKKDYFRALTENNKLFTNNPQMLTRVLELRTQLPPGDEKKNTLKQKIVLLRM